MAIVEAYPLVVALLLHIYLLHNYNTLTQNDIILWARTHRDPASVSKEKEGECLWEWQ